MVNCVLIATHNHGCGGFISVQIAPFRLSSFPQAAGGGGGGAGPSQGGESNQFNDEGDDDLYG